MHPPKNIASLLCFFSLLEIIAPKKLSANVTISIIIKHFIMFSFAIENDKPIAKVSIFVATDSTNIVLKDRLFLCESVFSQRESAIILEPKKASTINDIQWSYLFINEPTSSPKKKPASCINIWAKENHSPHTNAVLSLFSFKESPFDRETAKESSETLSPINIISKTVIIYFIEKNKKWHRPCLFVVLREFLNWVCVMDTLHSRLCRLGRYDTEGWSVWYGPLF